MMLLSPPPAAPALVPDAAGEALEGLEYHALMGVLGGDEPAHGRSFERSVTDRPAPAPQGKAGRDHEPALI